MIFSVASWIWSVCFALLELDVAFPVGAASIEEIVLRWVHIVAGILWAGFLSFFILAVGPMLKSLDPATRAKVFPELAARGALVALVERHGELAGRLSVFHDPG